MEPLNIAPKEDTPEIALDPGKGIFCISKRSLPENAIGFYEPVLTWFAEYIKTPVKLTHFEFKLEYFNTASAKQIAKLLLLLEKLSKTNEVVITWFYKKEDADMLASGTRFSKLIDLNFVFSEY